MHRGAFEGETVWLTQAQLVELFQSSKANVSEHIKNIYTEKELTSSNCSEFPNSSKRIKKYDKS